MGAPGAPPFPPRPPGMGPPQPGFQGSESSFFLFLFQCFCLVGINASLHIKCLRSPRARPLSPPTVQTPVHPRVDHPSPLLTLEYLVGLVHHHHLILAAVLMHLLVTRDPRQTALHLQAVLPYHQDPVECTLTDCV